MTSSTHGVSLLRAALAALVGGVAGSVVLGGVVLYAADGASQGRPNCAVLGYAIVALHVGGLGAAGGVALALRGAPTRPGQVAVVTVLVAAPLLWGLVSCLEPGLLVPASLVALPATLCSAAAWPTAAAAAVGPRDPADARSPLRTPVGHVRAHSEHAGAPVRTGAPGPASGGCCRCASRRPAW